MLSAWTPALVAQVSTNTTSQTVTQTPTPQQRQLERRKLLKILGLTQQELKGLAPADRRTRIKDATNQKITELQQKVTDGSITAQEQSDLAFLQKSLKHGKAKPPTDS